MAWRFFVPGGNVFITANAKEAIMDVHELKKLLAGFCIAGLIAGSSFAMNSCQSGNGA